MAAHRPVILATRGSALALAQAQMMLDRCRREFPRLAFALKIIKTTGDQRLTASLARPDPALPKGLFTKELEIALLEGTADLAVHSLKDLPTSLPPGLILGAVSARADVRDVLIYRDPAASGLGCCPDAQTDLDSAPAAIPRGFGPGLQPANLPDGAVIATSSTRRQAQLLELQPRLRTVEIRGNVLTRLRKLAADPALDATILAAAGLERLQYKVTPEGWLQGEGIPEGLRASPLASDTWIPCVGQAALGIEIRERDDRMLEVCQRLNHATTFSCITAERAFLRALGGGCQSPVAALAEMVEDQVCLRAVSFHTCPPRRADGCSAADRAAALGEEIAGRLRPATGG